MNNKRQCQRCGGELNISLSLYAPATGQLAEDGEITILDEQKPYIEEVLFYECPDCGAFEEETGFKLVEEKGVFYLRPIEPKGDAGP